jgi:hypothetical protein
MWIFVIVALNSFLAGLPDQSTEKTQFAVV